MKYLSITLLTVALTGCPTSDFAAKVRTGQSLCWEKGLDYSNHNHEMVACKDPYGGITAIRWSDDS